MVIRDSLNWQQRSHPVNIYFITEKMVILEGPTSSFDIAIVTAGLRPSIVVRGVQRGRFTLILILSRFDTNGSRFDGFKVTRDDGQRGRSTQSCQLFHELAVPQKLARSEQLFPSQSMN